MIQLKNIERSYKTPAGQTWVLRRINLDIREGEFITIMGPSGAGKSSLLNVLALLDDEWEGEYWFREEAVHAMKRKQRADLAKRNIGMVFQSYHLLDDLTVRENIDLPLSYKDIPRSQRQGMVADTLDRFQMVAKKDLYPNQLSGGQQQLVGIARAVIHKPPLLLADEPTGNLHSTQAKEIMELFRDLNQAGTTIVQVTHSEANAAYGSRIIQLRDGWMVSDSSNRRPPAAWRGGQPMRGFLRALLGVSLVALSLIPTFAAAQSAAALQLEMPKSHNPFGAYMPNHVPQPVLVNSPRLDQLIKDGKLYLSLKDAIDLALENNLDLAIARYNLPIAETDVLRTRAGGYFRGVNTGVVQGTPGGGVGGSGSGAGAGGTTGGAGGAGAGASGLVQSTLGTGTAVSSYDPSVNANVGSEHLTQPLSNFQIYGVPALKLNTTQANFNVVQALPTGTTFSFEFDNNRQTTNSIFSNLTPVLELVVSGQLPAAASRGIWPGPESALSAHRQEQQEDFRHRLQRPDHRHHHSDRKHLLGPRQRLRAVARE